MHALAALPSSVLFSGVLIPKKAKMFPVQPGAETQFHICNDGITVNDPDEWWL